MNFIEFFNAALVTFQIWSLVLSIYDKNKRVDFIFLSLMSATLRHGVNIIYFKRFDFITVFFLGYLLYYLLYCFYDIGTNSVRDDIKNIHSAVTLKNILFIIAIFVMGTNGNMP